MRPGSVDGMIEEVFDDALSRYRFETRVSVDKYAGDDLYDSVDFVVHPGWTAKNYERAGRMMRGKTSFYRSSTASI